MSQESRCRMNFCMEAVISFYANSNVRNALNLSNPPGKSRFGGVAKTYVSAGLQQRFCVIIDDKYEPFISYT